MDTPHNQGPLRGVPTHLLDLARDVLYGTHRRFGAAGYAQLVPHLSTFSEELSFALLPAIGTEKLVMYARLVTGPHAAFELLSMVHTGAVANAVFSNRHAPESYRAEALEKAIAGDERFIPVALSVLDDDDEAGFCAVGRLPAQLVATWSPRHLHHDTELAATMAVLFAHADSSLRLEEARRLAELAHRHHA